MRINENKVFVLFEHDSFEFCGVKGVFDTKSLANKARDIYTKSSEEDHMMFSYFVKEFDVEKTIYGHFNP